MIEVLLTIIAIWIMYRIATRKERKKKRFEKRVWFIAKRKLRHMQKRGELDPNIDLDVIKGIEIDY